MPTRSDESTEAALRAEVAELRARLERAEEMLRAARGSDADALVVESPGGPRVFTLQARAAESSRFQREMLAQVSDAVIAIDREQRITFLNAAAERQYRVDARTAVGRPLAELYEYRWLHPGDEAAAKASLAERGEWRGENLHVTRDGRELRVESSVTMLRDAAGEPIGMLAAVRDVTEQRKMEALADAARGQVESIINHTPAIVYAFDLEARFLWANTAVAELWKTTPEELRGRRRQEFMPREDAEWHEANDRAVLAAGTAIVFEEQSRLPDRTIFWLTTKFPLRDAQGKIYAIAGISTDVTERKQAEEALRGRSEELETLLDALPAFVWISRDADCRVIVGNRAANELTRTEPGANVSQSVADSGGAPYLRQFKEDGTEYRVDELPLQRAVATGQPVRDAVLDFNFPDGRRVQALGTAVPLFDEAGRPRGGLAAFLDITERKRDERELQERAGQLDLLARTSQRLIDCAAPDRELLAEIFGDIARLIGVESFYHFRADPAERHLHLETFGAVNEEAQRLVGSMKFGDLLCGRVAETRQRIVIEDLQRSARPGSEALHALGAQSYAGFALLDTREELLGVLAFISRKRTHFREGDMQMIETICAQVAVTIERARLLDELRESRERMRLAAEATGVGIWEWNVASGRIRWDAQMFRLYGVAATEDGFVNYETWRDAVLPDDLPAQEAMLMDTVRRLGRSSREFRILRADDGECRWIQAVEMVRANREGQVEWVVGTNLDVTEAKRAESAIREEAQRKDEFLAMLGHELRNPLNAIRHAVQIARDTPEDLDACHWANAVIDRQSQQLARMVDDLLDVARINRGRIDLRPEPLELATVLERAVAVVRPLLAQRRHAFESEIGSQLRVTGDATRLEQIFVNILSNAAKYTPEGGHISLRAQSEGGEAVITIADDGVGISAELLPYVFDLFRQADSSLDRALGGLGIGLNVVKSLVEMHLGRVTIDSAGPQTGTTVTVRLPLRFDLGTPPGPAVPPATRPRLAKALRVLVVDDHQDAAQALARLLRRMGCEVRLAHTGPDGVTVAREFVPEVLLLDIGLPGFDGYEVTRTLRADPRFAGALFIAISGYAQESDRARCLAEGFDDHFGKPLDFPKLAERIRARAAR